MFYSPPHCLIALLSSSTYHQYYCCSGAVDKSWSEFVDREEGEAWDRRAVQAPKGREREALARARGSGGIRAGIRVFRGTEARLGRPLLLGHLASPLEKARTLLQAPSIFQVLNIPPPPQMFYSYRNVLLSNKFVRSALIANDPSWTVIMTTACLCLCQR